MCLEDIDIDDSYFKEIVIVIQNFLFNPFVDNHDNETFGLKQESGFTNGELLYQLAQRIPDETEIMQFRLNIIIRRKY